MYDSIALSARSSGIRNGNPRGLWRDHPATPPQRKLGFSLKGNRPTQAELLIEMLRRACSEGRPLELPEIMAAGIAQHGARFHEIRARGFIVENETLRDNSGRTISRYFLRHDPERGVQ